MHSLTIALEKVDFFPPTRVTDDTSILTLKNLVFEPLVRWDSAGMRPGLFSHWAHSQDGRHWQFFIRPGARFHDGKACTPDDVLDYIGAILSAVDTFGMKWSYARYLADTRLSAGPANSVIVEDGEPIAHILDIFSEFFLCRPGPDGRGTVGTGPYRVTALAPGQGTTLERVAGGSAPKTIHAIAAARAEDRYLLLKSGRTDLALGLERIEDRLDFAPGLQWGKATTTLSVIYYLNCFAGPFSHPAARLAINHAIDTERMLEELFHGLGVRAATVVSPCHLGYSGAAVTPIGFDRDRARSLFDQAGAPSSITIRTPRFMPERALEVTRFVAAALADLGIASSIDLKEDRPEYAREVGRKQIGDMAIFDSSPRSTYRVLNDKISSTVRGIWWQGYDEPEAERLIGAAYRAVLPPDREAAYGRCLRYLNARPPWLYLFHPVAVFAAKPGIGGLSIDPKGVLNIT